MLTSYGYSLPSETVLGGAPRALSFQVCRYRVVYTRVDCWSPRPGVARAPRRAVCVYIAVCCCDRSREYSECRVYLRGCTRSSARRSLLYFESRSSKIRGSTPASSESPQRRHVVARDENHCRSLPRSISSPR